VPFLTFVKAIREDADRLHRRSEAALPRLDIMERFASRKHRRLRAADRLQLQPGRVDAHLSLCSVFVAQMAGVSMTLGQQLLMMLTLML
jgi:proton glutamate symport protein